MPEFLNNPYSVGAIAFVVAAVLFGWLGSLIQRKKMEGKLHSLDELRKSILAETEKEKETILKEAKVEAKDIVYKEKQRFEQDTRETKAELSNLEKKLSKREDNLDARMEAMEKRDKELQQKQKDVANMQRGLAEKDKRLTEIVEQEKIQLERIASLTVDQAKQLLLQTIEKDVARDAALIIKRLTEEAQEQGKRKATEILVSTMQRIVSEDIGEINVSSVPIPSDDIKGRIIGREGRNIRAFEAITGINLIIDDTPEAVVLSGFDPMRREMARMTLERLISDGRIHPGRIEEVYGKVQREMEENVKAAGEAASFDAGVHSLHPELVKILGRLKFRTSYGQNVLRHSVEVAFISSSLAAELGCNVENARRAGLLHDIGKALTFEMEGTHAFLGADFAKKHGESEDVVRAIAAHHNEREQEAVEDVIVALSDAISAARPGARREVIETYVKRLEQLEQIGGSFPGVERCFAIQAGREIRILVEPETVDDLEAIKLARDVSQRIEKEVQYPGQIKVTVVRETRAVEYAK